MNYFLNQRRIKQLCGEVSYKKGKKYFQEKKVTFKNYNPNHPIIEASVKGNHLFHVMIEKEKNGNIYAECTCPKLASYHKYCQHIAAVLICLHDFQVNGIPKIISSSSNSSDLLDSSEGTYEMHNSVPKQNPAMTKDVQLANEILHLFEDKPVLPISHQYHHDNRAVMDVEFTCKTLIFPNKKDLFGIEIKVGRSHRYRVHDFNKFLMHVEHRENYVLSENFTYNPDLHRFSRENDAVFKQLTYLLQEEKMYFDTLKHDHGRDWSIGDKWILIPPSSWEKILQLLSAAPLVNLEHDKSTYDGIHVSNETIPLEFAFDESNDEGYQLSVRGLDRIIVMGTYNYVLFEGKLYKLPAADCKRLLELKQMLEASGQYYFQIPSEQMVNFMEKVMPGFMKLGNVRIAQVVSDSMMNTPFKGKLFLDRVKNRLLAGLEFHYGNLIINPLEENSASGPLFRRNGVREQEIMQLMEDSSFTKTDSGYFLHNEEEEYHFLNHIVPKLKKKIEIYASTAVKDRVYTMKSPPKVRVEVDERTDWLIFQFDMQGIPESEIRDVLLSLKEKSKYYRLKDGRLVSLENKVFQEMNQFLNTMGMDKEDLNGEEIRTSVIRGLHKIESFQGSILTKGTSFRKILENLQSPDNLEFKIPDSLNPVLRNYQQFGVRWLKTLAHYKFGGILADDMGLGKTLQSITYIVSVLSEIRKREKQPVLVVTPSSLVYNWLNELNKFAPELQAVIVDGSKTERNSKFKDANQADVIITSYPLLRMDLNMYLKQSFHTLILDEAQAFKNHTTQTAKAVKKIQADYRFALTGTPVENSIDDLWSIFYVVFPNLLPERKAFKDLPRKTIAKIVNPFILRRLKEDVLKELPEKIESIHISDLLPEQKKLYAAYLAKLKYETLKHLDKDTFQKNRFKILAGLTRLRQLCCHPALFIDGYEGSSAKFEQLMAIVEECHSTGRRILIFSQFTKMLEIISRELAHKGFNHFYLDGHTPSAERVELCHRFNNGESDLFLISLKAGGTGLNLTGADTVILYDLWWNPAVEQQAADRAHRMGQKNKVQVIKLLTHGTIEEKMNQLQEKKMNLIEEIIQPDQDNLSTLTEQEIRDILLV
ncbi:SNF2 helicase associated domain-containing protein [Rossellomorea sp. BNER]|uniref:DEAD/DEAH box helicase n=1 Tax=Rossellomorea sp. BNER TaxID=2962031 RepID=UPI003AF2CA90|nr:DEAD/DEAH box helicase [Rossellomorea sp. BNER]